MATGMLLLAFMKPEISYSLATFNIMLTGFGLGMTMPLYTIAVQNAVPYHMLGTATSSVPFVRSVGGSVGLAIFGSALAGRFTTEFTTRLPTTLKSILPTEEIAELTHNPQALVSPQAQEQLKNLLLASGPQGSQLYAELSQILSQALSAALTHVFFIGFIALVLALAIHLFIKEIPLRKEHDYETCPPE
jgi:hypothetical protein